MRPSTWDSARAHSFQPRVESRALQQLVVIATAFLIALTGTLRTLRPAVLAALTMRITARLIVALRLAALITALRIAALLIALLVAGISLICH